MNRINDRALAPALVTAGATLAATGLAKLAPQSPWCAAAAIALIATTPLAADVVRSRHTDESPLPSAGSWLLGILLGIAGYIVAGSSLGELAAMMPILGACAVAPFLEAPRSRRRDCPPVESIPPSTGGAA